MLDDNSTKLINLKESLGIKKLGKTEKRVLVALLQQREHSVPNYFYYPEGNNYIGLAEIVYGIEYRAYHDLALEHSVYSTLSSVLHRLERKGLVKMCTPHYRRRYVSKEDACRIFDGPSCGFMEVTLLGLYVGYGGEYIHLNDRHKTAKLPERTHKWWILTEEGKELAQLLPV